MTLTSKRKDVSRAAWLFLLLCIFASLRLDSGAQIRPVYDQGSLGLAQMLKRLNTTASVLMIGAHPDDEDTALLAYLARGESARTAYLSLTRGDGGQNLIGPELGEALGVIRTEELLQARRLDGAEQFFTRAYDFGFSKTLAEAKEKWDEKIILCDAVRVIRAYRPMVVISVFNGTPADGHGQHQYAGYISPLAVKAADDPSQCVDTGAPWRVKKFFVRHRGLGESTLQINTGKYDPLLGRSYFEIAMQARSQHRSQEQGVLELKGDLFSNLDLKLIDGAAFVGRESGIFDNLNAANPGKPDLKDYEPLKPELLIPPLLERLPESRNALLRAAGVRIDVLADQETAVPGDSVPVAVRVFTPQASEIRLIKAQFNFPQSPRSESVASASNFFGREKADLAEYSNIAIPADTRVTQPNWLQSPRSGDLFSIQNGMSPSEPFGISTAFADVTLEIGGKQIVVRRPLEFRYADDIRGETRREFNVVPKLAVALDRELLIVSTAAQQLSREIAVSVTNNTNGATDGNVRLTVPNGWKVTPSQAAFSMQRKNEKATAKFKVEMQRNPGTFQVTAEATSNGETFSQTMQTIAYEHIQTHRIYRPAKTDVRLLDLRTVPVKVGYIRGSGDRVAEAIGQLGIAVEDIDAATLASADLSRFDTIVVGIRAYQVRPDLVANNQRLLDFVKNGGTLIVQYQLPQTYAQQDLTPFPTQMGPRVVDENAWVTILYPAHPIFNFPNKITSADFEGWVQERNLYNFSTMDAKYVGLLESHDAGEPENKGGLVVADIGKGKYIYCSYSLFRQLPAGVPGAYRLLANLLSSGKTNRSSRGN
ncbi:MAG: PIG-L family deacetylase [Acidobacteriota bacterium]